jgi:hypothetical protein
MQRIADCYNCTVYDDCIAVAWQILKSFAVLPLYIESAREQERTKTSCEVSLLALLVVGFGERPPADGDRRVGRLT